MGHIGWATLWRVKAPSPHPAAYIPVGHGSAAGLRPQSSLIALACPLCPLRALMRVRLCWEELETRDLKVDRQSSRAQGGLEEG